MLKLQITNYKLQKNTKSQCQISKPKPPVFLSLCPCVYFVSFVLPFVILMTGCAAIKEAGKGFAGVSTKILEDNRKSAIMQKFDYDYFTCYTKALDSLKLMQAYIYTQDIKKHMIAIYVSEQDTTPVVLFFKELDASHTQLEVSSPSTYAKELIANKLFPVLEEQIKSRQK